MTPEEIDGEESGRDCKESDGTESDGTENEGKRSEGKRSEGKWSDDKRNDDKRSDKQANDNYVIRRRENDEYVIRPFEPGDSDAFLALYREVFGGDRTDAWLDWKYASNPSVDDTPIMVAERDGELVGARPFFSLRMRAGNDVVLAFQPADAMVHADHRRRGLFTRMTEAAIERHRAGEPALYFNFPNPKSLPGNLELGWEVVGELPTFYRIQRPGALLDSMTGRIAGGVTPLLDRAGDAYHRVNEQFTSLPGGVEVRRSRSVPAATLAGLSGEDPPGGLHAVRDESFYAWRFGAAPTTYLTYVAERGGSPRCALIVAEGTYMGEPVRRVVDVAPVSPGGQAAAAGDPGSRRERRQGSHGGDRQDALCSALAAVIEDSRHCAAVVAPAMTLPGGTVEPLGFHRRSTPLLSRLTKPTPFVTRSLDGGDDPPSQTLDGIDLVDENSWTITFAEHDNR